MPADEKPHLDDVKDAFARLCEVIAALRHPETGCPWDLEQTHETLRRYLIEEAYEAAEQMHADADAKKLAEELGDVLLQVVLNAQLASDEGRFTILDVVTNIAEKMVRRHPHVFAGGKFESKQKLRSDWDAIKEEERRTQGGGTDEENKGVFDGVIGYPASLQAFEIGKQASKIKFDWRRADDVLAQLSSELSELQSALDVSGGAPSSEVRSELGDVFFTWAQLCRHLGWDPETVAVDGNRKFLERFKIVEALAAADGIDVRGASQGQLEKLWQRAKKKTPLSK